MPFEPVKLGAFAAPQEGVIATQRAPFEEPNQDVLDSFKNIPIEAWTFYFECCLIVVATFLVLWLVNKFLTIRRLPSGSKLRSKVVKQIWNVNMAFLDQVEYSPRSVTKRTLWFLFGVSLFCLFQVYESANSSNLSMSKESDNINTLNDVMQAMSDTPGRPGMILKFWEQFGMINMFSQAKDPVRKVIYGKTLNQPEPFVSISVGIDGLKKILTLMDRFKERDMVIIQTSLFVEIMVMYACYANEDNTGHKVDAYIGSEKFEGYAYGFIYSRNLSVDIRNYIDERMRVVLESGIYTEMLLGEMEETYELGYSAKTLKTMQCIARYHEKPEIEPQSVNLNDLRRLFKIYSVLVSVGISMVLVEFIVSGKIKSTLYRLTSWIKSIILICDDGFQLLWWRAMVICTKMKVISL